MLNDVCNSAFQTEIYQKGLETDCTAFTTGD